DHEITAEIGGYFHYVISDFSSELAQTSRSDSTGESITERPFSSMRKASPRVTLPISHAATLYCLAIARTAARFSGARETMARAPRSPKSANSAGAGSSIRAEAPKEKEPV